MILDGSDRMEVEVARAVDLSFDGGRIDRVIAPVGEPQFLMKGDVIGGTALF